MTQTVELQAILDVLDDLRGYSGVGTDGDPYDTPSWNAALKAAEQVYLSRDSTEKDPTVQALGIGGQITGARSNLIILDDVVTTSNAHEWEKQLLWLQRDVVTRLGDNGKLLIVGTRIAANDLYREIRNPDHWVGGKTPFTYFAMPAVS